MGVVWRAVDEVLGREVAVKELRTYTDSSGPELSELRVRMRREARAAARVRHPGVVAVHDIAEHEGRPVIVMELVDGPSLADVLAERGVMDPREAARIGAEVLGALAAAHEVGVLHRDVKPGNILLDRTGRVVLTDFGIAAVEDPGTAPPPTSPAAANWSAPSTTWHPSAPRARTPGRPPTCGRSAPPSTRRSRARRRSTAPPRGRRSPPSSPNRSPNRAAPARSPRCSDC